MRDSTFFPDWLLRLDRYVLRLMAAWSIVVFIALLWNLAQHQVDALTLRNDLPFWAELIGHSVMWLIGVAGIRTGSQRLRQQLRDRMAIRQARSVPGAIAAQPVEAADAEKILIGQRLTPEMIDAAAEAAFKPARPLDNADASYARRKKMVRVYVARALSELTHEATLWT